MHKLLELSTPLMTVFNVVKDRWKTLQSSEFEVCVGLRRLRRDNFHRGTTYSRFSTFADAELGIPEKLAWTFSSLGRHFERLPLLAEAVASGRLTYTKAREFACFIEPAEQVEWVEYAISHTNREIERHVAKYKADKEGREYEEKKKLTANLTGPENQVVRAAREKVMKDLDRPISTESLIPYLAERFLEDVAAREKANGQGVEGAGEAGQAAAPMPARPYAALDLCPQCKHSWVPVPGHNMEIKIEEWIENLRAGGEFVNLLPDFFCDCEDMLHRRDECPASTEAETEPGTKSGPAKGRYLPVLERKVIEARDGFRCRTPGCDNPLPLENGHLGTPHRDRAPMDREHVGEQCSVCNKFEQIGDLVIKGKAPFEKYYLRDGTFLGFGFDPTPWNRVSHVGQRPRGGEEGPADAESSRSDTG